jgi:hypothetical protein
MTNKISEKALSKGNVKVPVIPGKPRPPQLPGGTTPKPVKTTIEWVVTDNWLDVGNSWRVHAEITPAENLAEMLVVTASNKEVATIEYAIRGSIVTFTILGVSPGTAKFTITAGDAAKTLEIVVVDPLLSVLRNGKLIGGGVILYVRETNPTIYHTDPAVHIAPVTLIDNPVRVNYDFGKRRAVFHTVPGRHYTAHLEMYLEGANNTYDIGGLNVNFTAIGNGNDEISFCVNAATLHLFVNDLAHNSTTVWKSDIEGTNAELRNKNRENFYLESCGGFGYGLRYMIR